MKCGDVLLLDYPFTDQSGSKLRPALVVSSDAYNKGEDFVIVPISSKRRSNDANVVEIREGDGAFQQTGLRWTSFIKWTKPLTVSGRVASRRLGHVSPESLADIQSRIQDIFRPL